MFDSWFVQRTSCSRFGVGDAFDCGEYPFADFRFVAANRETEFRLVWNDVIFCAGLNISDRDYGYFSGLHFAGNNCLQRDHRTRSDHDWVDRAVGLGAMTSLSINGDAQRIRI